MKCFPTGGPLITEDAQRSSVLVGILKGGGLDCSRLGEEDYQPTQNGIWMKIQAFNDWISTTIFNELLQGNSMSFRLGSRLRLSHKSEIFCFAFPV